MDALELFLLRYDDIHVGFVNELFKDLPDEQVRRRPAGLNSIVWLVWHLARVQDAVVSRIVADRRQALDEGRWNERMAIDRRDVGSGMTSAEVDALSAEVDVAALRQYHRAVAERTKLVATSLPPGGWSETIAEEQVRRIVVADGLLVEAGRWVEDFWARKRSRGWYLLQVGLLHPYGHCFDGMVTRGALAVAE